MMLHLEKLFYSVPQRMSVCGFCLSYTLPWDLGLFCCIPTFVFLNIVCGGNFHLSRQQMWMRTKFSNRCRIRRWPNRLPFYSSNNSGHWASVGYTWYGFTNIIRHQLFVRQYLANCYLIFLKNRFGKRSPRPDYLGELTKRRKERKRDSPDMAAVVRYWS